MANKNRFTLIFPIFSVNINLLFLVFLLGSCATIINKKTTKINVIIKNNPIQYKFQVDSNNWHDSSHRFTVIRSALPLSLRIKSDSVEQTFTIKRTYSQSFLFGNIVTFAGIGYVVDLFNNKRFGYPKQLYILKKDSKIMVKKWISGIDFYPKKSVLLNYYFPTLNNFYFKMNKHYSNYSGLLGLGLGLAFKLNQNKTINLRSSIVSANLYTTVYIKNNVIFYPKITATNIDFSINHYINKFIFGFGLGYFSNYYSEKVQTTTNLDSTVYMQFQNHFGLVLSGYYYISKPISIGFNYLPHLLAIEKKKLRLNYNHLMYIDLKCTFNLYSPKKKNQLKLTRI